MNIFILPAILIVFINIVIFFSHRFIKKHIHTSEAKKIIIGDVIIGDLFSATALSIYFITIPYVGVIKDDAKKESIDKVIEIFTLIKLPNAPLYTFIFLLVIFFSFLGLSLIYKEKDDAMDKIEYGTTFFQKKKNYFKNNKFKHISNVIGLVSISLIFLIITNYITQLFKLFQSWIST